MAPFLLLALRSFAADHNAVVLMYPVNDQHDNVSILLQDAITDRNTHRLEKEARLVQYQSMLAASGSVPAESILSLENQIAQDVHATDSDIHRVKSLEQKLRSLNALREGRTEEFLQADRQANRELLAQFEAEKKKAELELRYRDERYQRVHVSYLGGSGPWARDHEAKLDLRKAEAALDGWKRKVIEQAKQTTAAESELKNSMVPPSPPRH